MKARTKDGAEIYYEINDFTDPWKPAETILLAHGNRGNHRQWYNWVPVLGRKYRTVTMDARGRGLSTIPEPGFPYSLEQFATDALAVLDAAGAEKAHYLGTSFGGVVGLYLGATYPERFLSMTLMSTPYRFTNLSETKQRWLREMEEYGALEFLRRDVPNMFPKGADPAMIEWQAQQMASVPFHVAMEMMRFTAGLDLVDLLPRISAPVLLLAAARSDRAPRSESLYMKDLIPNVRFEMLEGEHNIQLSMPEKCMEIVLDFLSQHPAK